MQLLQDDMPTLALQFVTGAIVTQILLIGLASQMGALDAAGIVQGFAGGLGTVIRSLSTLDLALFGIFDLAGGIGFCALINAQAEGIVPVKE